MPAAAVPDPQPALLLVKFGAIGDVVMAIPAAFALHERGYRVDWLCGETVAPVLRLYPWINVLAVDERTLLRGSAPARLRAIFVLWRQLAGRHYDLCATLYYDSRYRLLTLPVRARAKFLLSHEDRNRALLPGRHHTDEFARILLAHLPVPVPEDVTPRQLGPVRAPGLPPSPLPGPAANTPRVVLVPAGARNTLRDDTLRRWPVENYAALATSLLQAGCEVVLAGGPDDLWASPAFAHLPVRDLMSKLTLPQTLALLDSAQLTVTHDTGPLHLAGITSTAILTLFGPTDPHGRLPQRARCVALWGGEGFACRPCYDGHNYAPCTLNGCIRQVTPAMAFAEAKELLTAVREGNDLPPRIATPEHTQPLIFPAGGAF